MNTLSFEWDDEKNWLNELKHDLSFEEAQMAFCDPNHLIIEDLEHSDLREVRLFCIGRIDRGICTVRFTYRDMVIRIYGAGFWRKGKKRYEKENR